MPSGFGRLPLRVSLSIGRDIVARFDRSKERLKSIVVLLQDRIELVIVASSTREPQPEEYFSRYIRQIIEDVIPLRAHVPLIVFVDPVS